MSVPSGLIGLVAVICILGGPFLCAIIGIICSTVEKVSRQRAEANLKQMMLQRGFSAAEIERACNAKVDSSLVANQANWQPIAPAKPAKV